MNIERTGRDFMQCRLLDVQGVPVNECDMCRTVTSPQAGGEFKATGAATNDDDLVISVCLHVLPLLSLCR